MKASVLAVNEIATFFNKEIGDIEDSLLDSKLYSEHDVFMRMKSILDITCIMLKDFESSFKYNPDIVHAAQMEFRQITNPLILKSYFLNRMRTWPQGYQGDYKTLEMVYRNIPLSEGIGYFFDRYALQLPLAIGVKNRLTMAESFLRQEIPLRQKPKILNIACGSCRELMTISADIKRANAKVVCVDDDSDALNFSFNRLSYTEAIKNMTFKKYNVLRMFDYESVEREFGNQDIIYSIGLFDYLPKDFLVNLISALYKLLNPDGKLVFAFKDALYYDSTQFHWMTDWNGFKQRTDSDFQQILSEAHIPSTNISSERDETSIILFYSIYKG